MLGQGIHGCECMRILRVQVEACEFCLTVSPGWLMQCSFRKRRRAAVEQDQQRRPAAGPQRRRHRRRDGAAGDAAAHQQHGAARLQRGHGLQAVPRTSDGLRSMSMPAVGTDAHAKQWTPRNAIAMSIVSTHGLPIGWLPFWCWHPPHRNRMHVQRNSACPGMRPQALVPVRTQQLGPPG